MLNDVSLKKAIQNDWSMAASAQLDATKGHRTPQFGEGSQMTSASAPGSAPVPTQARQQQFC